MVQDPKRSRPSTGPPSRNGSSRQVYRSSFAFGDAFLTGLDFGMLSRIGTNQLGLKLGLDNALNPLARVLVSRKRLLMPSKLTGSWRIAVV